MTTRALRRFAIACLAFGLVLSATAGTPSKPDPEPVLCAGRIIHHWADQQNDKLPLKIRSFLDHPSTPRALPFADKSYTILQTRRRNLSYTFLYPVPTTLKHGYQMSTILSLRGISQTYASDRSMLLADYDGHFNHGFCRCVVLYLWNPRGYRKVLQSESDYEGKADVIPFRIGHHSPVFVSAHSMTGPHHSSWKIYKVEDNDTVQETLDFEGDDATLEYRDLNGDGISEVIADRMEAEGASPALEREVATCSKRGFDWHHAFHIESKTVYRWIDGRFKALGTYYQIKDERS